MKKTNTYSAQFKIIQPHQNHSNHKNRTRIRIVCQIGKQLTKDRQEFVNNVAAN